jgi:hypothetical protein
VQPSLRTRVAAQLPAVAPQERQQLHPSGSSTATPLQRSSRDFRVRAWHLLALIAFCLASAISTVVAADAATPGRSAAKSTVASSSLPLWVSVGALTAAVVSAIISFATFLSTREARNLDVEIKKLDRDQKDNNVQAKLVETAEQNFRTMVGQVFNLLDDVQHLGRLRDEATIDPSRPLALPATSFTLRPSTASDYQSRLGIFRAHLMELDRTLMETRKAIAAVRDNSWPVRTVALARTLRDVQAAHDRLTTDSDPRLSEISRIVTETHRLADSQLQSMLRPSEPSEAGD